MKKILILLLLVIAAGAAKSQSSVADSVAQKLSRKMKDSLSLTEDQRIQLYQLNMQLHEAKMARRQLYTGTDSLQIHIQRVESMRDSLYRAVLTEEQHVLYLQKKRNLINNQ
jgi:ABC-type hemin transport system ATPase subunit